MGYPAAPVDDVLVFNIAFGKTVADISANAVANLGYADIRFLEPVYAGDTITAESEVIGLRPTSGGDSGVVYVRSTALNQHGLPVLTWIRWVLVRKRDKAAPNPATLVPDLPPTVHTAQLPVPALTIDRAALSLATGSARFWEDYAAGERIDHPAGMTLDESDHTLATKLYQNTAKVHFDAHLMKDTTHGRRLIYGGHVISVCRALSYDGLENVLGILAINGGIAQRSHVCGRYAVLLHRGARQDRDCRPPGLRRTATAAGRREEQSRSGLFGNAHGGWQDPHPSRCGARPRLHRADSARLTPYRNRLEIR